MGVRRDQRCAGGVGWATAGELRRRSSTRRDRRDIRDISAVQCAAAAEHRRQGSHSRSMLTFKVKRSGATARNVSRGGTTSGAALASRPATWRVVMPAACSMISRWHWAGSAARPRTPDRQTTRLSDRPGAAPGRAQRWAAAPLGRQPATVVASRDSSAAEEVQRGAGPSRARRNRQRGWAPERLRRLHSRPSAPAAHRHAGRRRAARRRGSPSARLRRRDAPGGRLGARRSDPARARRRVPPAVSAPPTPTRSVGCTCSAAPGHAPSHRVRTVQADPYVRTQNTGARGSPLGANLLRADRARWCGIGGRRFRQPPLPLLAFAPPLTALRVRTPVRVGLAAWAPPR